ncbi:Gfo/Idh/MocA family oxidoreductase [uncultured Roseovarius sp.]|uniref:Gfo/Idh/MocA family protein n=1 Tax=uncultured Roseovarius sp. TaxID=293344 RepID=UPI00261392CA|nr:Gfo/Idh/MocA family oxidoreductase [uncultured Roseovarius sp.]
MKDPIRLGIVGTGAMAARMMHALAAIPDFTVHAVASRSEGRACEFAKGFDVPKSFGSSEELSEQPDVEAVYICGQSGNHVSDGLAALKARKPILLEKPLATKLKDAKTLANAARSGNCLLMENLWCLALPSYLELSERLNSQSYGKPVHLQFSFGYPVMREGYPSIYDPQDGGALLDRGVYGISLAIHLLGPAESVHAAAQFDENGTDLTTDVCISHVSGATSQISVSLNALMSNTAALSCTHGILQLGAPIVGSESLLCQQMSPEGIVRSSSHLGPTKAGFKSRLKSNPMLRKIKRFRDATAAKFIPHGSDQYIPILEHFRNLIRGGRNESNLIPLELSLATQEVLDQARRQSRGA